MELVSKKILTTALIPLLSLCLSSCSKGNSAAQNDPTLTQAYQDGLSLNQGVSAATLENAGGAENYCSANLALHSEYSATEKKNYVLGCLDAVAGSNYDSEQSSSDADYYNQDLLYRLQNAGGTSWSEDAFTVPSASDYGLITDYLADGCTVWVFDSQNSAESAYDYGFFDTFTEYQLSVGTDVDGNGVMVMYLDEVSSCANDVLTALNWSSF